MARSDWDCMAFDTTGNPCSGDLPLGNGASAEIYKNWVYLRHPAAWFEGCNFAEPTIMEIRSGDMYYAACDIIVERYDLQRACFVLVMQSGERLDGRWHRPMCAGLGCATDLDEIEYIERYCPEKIDLLPKWWREASLVVPFGDVIVCRRYGHSTPQSGADEYVQVDLWQNEEMPDMHVGVTQEMYEAFVAWLENIEGVSVNWLTKVKSTSARRYNQGDRVFAQRFREMGIGIDDDVSTPIGEQECESIAMSVICRNDPGDTIGG